MSKALLKTYAETQFGMVCSKNRVDRFYSLIYEVATDIRLLYYTLREKNNYNRYINYDRLVSNFILSNQCNPDFLFYLIDQSKNKRHEYCKYKVNKTNLLQDIHMLEKIDQRMSDKDLEKFHSWFMSYNFYLQRLDAEIMLNIHKLLNDSAKNNLTVIHKGITRIATQANKRQNYLTVVR